PRRSYRRVAHALNLVPGTAPKASGLPTADAAVPGTAGNAVPAPPASGELLAGVHEALGIERALDRLVQLDGAGRPLAAQLAVLDHADPVLACHRPAQPQRE